MIESSISQNLYENIFLDLPSSSSTSSAESWESTLLAGGAAEKYEAIDLSGFRFPGPDILQSAILRRKQQLGIRCHYPETRCYHKALETTSRCG